MSNKGKSDMTPSTPQLDSQAARELIERDRQDRANSAAQEINAVCQRYNVELTPKLIIFGAQIQADIQIVPKD